MPSPKKKPSVHAADVAVGARTLENVLIDLAEQLKDCAARSSKAEERSARAEERSARAEERSARAEERSARAEELATIALQTLSALTRDLIAIGLRTRALEKAAGMPDPLA